MKTVPNVPEIVKRPGQQCSFIGALEAVLKTRGEGYDYVDLMGLSAAAFRVRLARSSWDGIMGGRIHPAVSTDGCFGPHADAAMAATGYRYQIAERMHDGTAGVERLAEMISQEIDAGRPLLGMNMHNGTSWGVVCGYDENTPATADGDARPAWVWCRSTYDPPGAVPTSPPQFPTEIWSIAREGDPPARAEQVRASLLLAAELLTTEKAKVRRTGGWIWHYEPEYVSGLAAYDAWVADLEDEAGIAALPPDQRLMYWQGNAVMYSQLLDARDAACAYLGRVAPSLPEEVSVPLTRAAEVLGQLVDEMVAEWDCLPFHRGGYVHENGWLLREGTSDLLGKTVPPYADAWTPEMRRQTAQVLRSTQSQDREVLELLQQTIESSTFVLVGMT